MNTNNFNHGKTYKTDDYSIFDTHENNRPIHDDVRLLDSLKKHGFAPSGAIHCRKNGDGKLKIIRGHHRFRYAKMLKIPIYYTVDDTAFDLYELEGSSMQKWSSMDFLYSRARSGDKVYKELLAYQRKHNLPLRAAASLFGGESGGSCNKLRQVKTGTFQKGDQDHGNKVIEVINALDKHRLDFNRSGSFVKAVSLTIRIPDLSYTELLHRTSKYGAFLRRRANCQDYLEEIEALYNRNNKKALPIKHLAFSTAKKRQETFGKENK